MLGAVRYTDPDDLERALDLLHRHADGKPYGLDVVMPAKKVEGVTEADVEAMIPEGHRGFVRDLLARHGVPELAEGETSGWRITGWMEEVARGQLDVAFDYPVKLLANALGSPPADVIARAHDHGVLVAALAGSARHARRHAEAGIDVVVAQGYEAGGHTGEIGTMVLVPEVVEAVAPLPVLAAGGIGSGEQAAAGLALGAQGVWLGSLWLTTEEADLHSEALTAKLLACFPGTPSAPGPSRASPRASSVPNGPTPGTTRRGRAPCPCRSRGCWSPRPSPGSRRTRSARCSAHPWGRSSGG